MKTLPLTLMICALAISSFGQPANTNAPLPSSSATNKAAPPVATFLASAGEVKAPLVIANGILSQPDTTDATEGGKATYSFAITNAGNYVIKAMVDAPADDANSFFINVDAQPSEPENIWDIEPTNGFEERTVSWRGSGDSSSDEFSPKRFNLSVGTHKLMIVGREPAQLKSISIHPAAD